MTSLKLVIADTLSPWVAAVFNSNAPVMFFEASAGALCYTFQIYFDFSGYSDMALGIGRFFNIELPINFNSPYKATSIIDFWIGNSRCYHNNIVPKIICRNDSLETHDVVNVGAEEASPFEMLVKHKKMMACGKLENANFCFFVLDPEFFFESLYVKKHYEKIFLNSSQWSVLAFRYGNFYFVPYSYFFELSPLCTDQKR